MKASPRSKEATPPTPRVQRAPAVRPVASASQPPAARRPAPATSPSRPATLAAANGNGRSLSEALNGLRDANGATVRKTAVASASPGRSLGELLEQTANDSLCKCIESLIGNGH